MKRAKKEKIIFKNREYVYSIACFLLMIDQLVKLLVRSKVPLLDEVEVLPGFFSIYHIKNSGAAFSLFSGSTLVLIILSILVLFFLHYYVLTEEHMTKWRIFGFGIVIGGIIGNLVDRILYGAVIDYLSFHFFGYDFPIFNIADIGITFGFLIIAIGILRRDSNAFRSQSNDGARRKEN